MPCAGRGGSAAAVSEQARKNARASGGQIAQPKTVRRAKTNGKTAGQPWYSQARMQKAYQLPSVQKFIGLLIMGNFITNCVEKQIDPRNEFYPDHWFYIELGWNTIFILELLWNMYGCFYFRRWKGHFFRSGWNIFDFIVVIVSIPSMLGITLPGPMSQLRMLRAFRVFRLFKRIKSLNKIIVSLSRAVPGIINAGLVMFLVMCIYAILAVDLFGDFGADGYYTNIEGRNVTLRTTRGMTFGEEYYGTFCRSLYSLFQVLTGESWSEVVARPLIFADSGEPGAVASPIFYVTFILVCGIVLINVAVAVLLEKMVEDPEAAEGIDPDEAEQRKLEATLLALDRDGDGEVTKEEFRAVFKKSFPHVPFEPVWREIDQDGDGSLSMAELAEYYGMEHLMPAGVPEESFVDTMARASEVAREEEDQQRLQKEGNAKKAAEKREERAAKRAAAGLSPSPNSRASSPTFGGRAQSPAPSDFGGSLAPHEKVLKLTEDVATLRTELASLREESAKREDRLTAQLERLSSVVAALPAALKRPRPNGGSKSRPPPNGSSSFSNVSSSMNGPAGSQNGCSSSTHGTNGNMNGGMSGGVNPLEV